MADNQVIGAGINGAGSGAIGGATAGSAFGPVGTAIGAVGGALIGGISSALKTKGDLEEREKEVKRLQEREDTAVRRSVADSLAAGIDPRSSEKPVDPASSAGVEPYQAESGLGELTNAFSSASNVLNNRYINEARIQDSAINSLTEAYKNRKIAAQSGLNETDSLIEKWTSDFKETQISENEIQKSTENKVVSNIQRLHRKLKDVKVDYATKERILNECRKSNGDKDYDKWSVGGGGDVGSAVIGAVDNVFEQFSRNSQTISGAAAPAAPAVSQSKEIFTDPRTGKEVDPAKVKFDEKGNPYLQGEQRRVGTYNHPNGNVTPTYDSGRIPLNRNVVDVPSSSQNSAQPTKTETNQKGNRQQKRTHDQNQKNRRLKLSGGYEDYGENWQSEENTNANETNKDTLVSFTNDEINEIVSAYTKETLKGEISKNRREFVGYDVESKLKQFQELQYLEMKRQMYLNEYQKPPLEFFQENYQAADSFYRQIYKPYKFFRK